MKYSDLFLFFRIVVGSARALTDRSTESHNLFKGNRSECERKPAAVRNCVTIN